MRECGVSGCVALCWLSVCVRERGGGGGVCEQRCYDLSCLCMCMCACMCVCVRAGERKRERECVCRVCVRNAVIVLAA